MVKISWKVFIILVILFGFILLGLHGIKEGFQAGQPGIRCGVDLPTCNPGKQCMNGFCETAVAPALQKNQLPVFP